MRSSVTTQLLRRGEEAARDFEVFVRFVLNLKPAKHERSWINAAQDIGDNPTASRCYILVAPPGSGKTTVIGVGFTAWMIGRYPAAHVGLLSYADQAAWDRSLPVRNLVEKSKEYHFAFPDVLPDLSAWGRSSFRVKRANLADPHPTLRAGGAMSATIGYRLNGLVIDDPHDQKNSSSPRLRAKTFGNFEEALETRLTTGAWQMIIGTRWADDDFIGRLLERKRTAAGRPKPSYTVYHTPALDVRGNSYWAERYPFEELAQIRYNKPVVFAVQYLGDTTGGDTSIIKRVSTHTELPSPAWAKERDLLIGMGADTAFKDQEQNDFTVVYVVGLDRDGNLWVLDRVKGRWGVMGVAEQLQTLAEVWDPYNIWVEDAAAGTPAVQTLRALTPSVPTELVAPSAGGKVSRANALAPYLHNGQIRFPARAEWFQDAEYQFTHFGHTGFYDDVDALFMVVSNLLEVPHPASYEAISKLRLRMR